jgi:hypothetical protein
MKMLARIAAMPATPKKPKPGMMKSSTARSTAPRARRISS